MIDWKKTSLGIELGSTRIKAVLVDETLKTLASGEHEWENRYENGIWTYSEEDIVNGIQHAYAELKGDVRQKYGETLKETGAVGISAMMHGYLVLDKNDKILTPFRTWRNNNAQTAADLLTEAFGYHIPARWSIAHLYQAILDKEAHVKDIAFQTTLEGYVHYLLTGEKVIGIGEASGMFPIDTSIKNYYPSMIEKFDELTKDYHLPFRLTDIFPKVLLAGENAGFLTRSGALLLDPEGDLSEGIPLAPPEGDAGTGMVATNAVRVRTGNVSAGTSIFAMIVLEKELSKVYPEIDLVTTPSGDLVGMVHCNNCTSDLNAWIGVFDEFAKAIGVTLPKNKLFETLFFEAEKGDKDCGGLLAYNYVSGENITGVDEGRPLFVRTSESRFDLRNFMRANLYASMATLKLGSDIMLKQEGVKVDSITAHGGLFKTERVGQSFLAAALGSPVTVMETAGEGGAWGMAVLASFLLSGEKDLATYLDEKVFNGQKGITVQPDEADRKGFDEYAKRYRAGLPVVREAVKVL